MGSQSIFDEAIISRLMSGRRTWAYGLSKAFCRSFSAARSPMCKGAPER